MPSVTVSPKYQVVIPAEVRERLKIKPGQKVEVVEKEWRGSPDSHQTFEGLEGVDGRRIPDRSQRRRQPTLILVDSLGWIEYLPW